LGFHTTVVLTQLVIAGLNEWVDVRFHTTVVLTQQLVLQNDYNVFQGEKSRGI